MSERLYALLADFDTPEALVAAAQRLAPQAGQATLHEMRRRLGPIQGWPSLFGLLGDELGSALPAGTALVIETSALSDEARLTLQGLHKAMIRLGLNAQDYRQP